MTPCAYCGHPADHHDAGACADESRALPAGFRPCRCTAFRHPDEEPRTPATSPIYALVRDQLGLDPSRP